MAAALAAKARTEPRRAYTVPVELHSHEESERRHHLDLRRLTRWELWAEEVRVRHVLADAILWLVDDDEGMAHAAIDVAAERRQRTRRDAG